MTDFIFHLKVLKYLELKYSFANNGDDGDVIPCDTHTSAVFFKIKIAPDLNSQTDSDTFIFQMNGLIKIRWQYLGFNFPKCKQNTNCIVIMIASDEQIIREFVVLSVNNILRKINFGFLNSFSCSYVFVCFELI